jgi:hypothetical protein
VARRVYTSKWKQGKNFEFSVLFYHRNIDKIILIIEWIIPMNQRQAVIQVMKENGGYATLKHLYEHALEVPDVKWKTETPFASIRRIVQNERFFFKIRPGLWALNEYKESIPFLDNIKEDASKKDQEEFSHSFYQGLLIEIGNLQKFDTFVPHQDKNKFYLERPLHEVTTLSSIYSFSYDRIVRTAETVDVSWFNDRKLPDTFIEVEHSTDFYSSLIKFVELQDFNAKLWITAPEVRKKEFSSKLSKTAFSSINKRVRFLSYDEVSKLHSAFYEKALIESRFQDL